MSANIKANIKQQEMKDLAAYLKKKYLQTLKYNIKRGRVFHSILVGIPFVLILPIMNREVCVWEGCLRDKIRIA